MESETSVTVVPVIVDPWFEELRQTVSSLSKQSCGAVEECCAVRESDDDEGGFIPGTISSTLAILTSDADSQRKALVEYINNTNGVGALLELFESTAKFKVGEEIAKILRELLNPKSGKFRTLIVKQCVDINYLAVAVSVLKQLVKASGGTSSSSSPSPAIAIASSPDVSGSGGSLTPHITDSVPNDLGNGTATTVDFIWFLVGVIAKDTQAPDKVRQMLKVKFFHDVFKKLFFVKSNIQFPLLKIMKLLSKCRRSAEVLGKDKVLSTTKKCFAILNSQPNAKMLMLMDWLALLTRDRKNSIRFLKAGLLVKVLNCFRHWAHWRGKGLLKLSKSVINIYTHLARTKSGKKSLVQSDAITAIRTFSEQCPAERAFDDVITRACAMLHICYEKDTLPLEMLESPIKFEIPKTSLGLSGSPMFVVDSGSSSDEDDPEGEDADGNDDSDIESDNASENGSGNSDNDELCDNDEEAPGEASGLSRGRKESFDYYYVSAEEQTERSVLDRIAKYSYFFRELSSHYTQNDEMENMIAKLDKLELEVSDSRIFEEPEDALEVKSNTGSGDISSGLIPRSPSISFPSCVHKYSWTSRHGTRLPRMENLRKLYFHMANKIKHVSPFVKIAYPDICFGLSGKQIESLCANTDRLILRKNVHTCMARAMNDHAGFRHRVVYSLDELLAKDHSTEKGEAGKIMLENDDEVEFARYDPKKPLSFESRFESGNLRKAIQIGEFEYDLLLTSDINSSRHNQWFYFQVSNVSDDSPYVFNIINCIKANSLFNYGMQPMVYSVMDAMKHRPGWVRSGTGVCYYRNGYKCIGKKSVKTYHTLTFTMNFHNRGDIVYIAYYIPYTYTRLMVEVHNLLQTVKHSEKVHCRYDVLCKSLDGNDIPLVTITAPVGGNNSLMNGREVVFITSRVHPGETNASWVMMGILRKLMLGNNMEDLLQRYVFKIVPMLNVEGVVNGCHRSGLTSQDLNRCWRNPHEILHPSIYHTKMLVAYCCKIRGKRPEVFLDLHGHSRRKNAFFYGCSYARSWKPEDRVTPENPQRLYALAESMSVHSPYFVTHFCHYDVRKSRETTARVAIWREFGITRSFTLECSYCGCDRGPCKGITFGSGQLWEIGEGLCEAILTMGSKIVEPPQQKLPESESEEESLPIIDTY